MFEVGIDIVENKRIEYILKRYKKKFIGRILTQEEEEQYISGGEKLEYLAGRFCAKEAFFKATKKKYLSFQSIAILNDENGSPQLKIKSTNKNIQKISISISHSKEYTLAVCLIMV